MELPTDFWESFKKAVESNGLNKSIEELFFVDKRGFDPKTEIRNFFPHLHECKFQLKKLGLGLPYLSHEKDDIIQFLIQQSASVEYLQLPSKEGSRCFKGAYDDDTFVLDAVPFSKLVEVKFERLSAPRRKLLSLCPILEKIELESMTGWLSFLSQSDLDNSLPIPIKSVVFKSLLYFNCSTLFEIFPNANSLEIKADLKRPVSLKDIFTHGTTLKKLSIQVQFNILDERRLKRHGNSYQAGYSESDYDDRRRAHSRPIKADCFILGQKPRHCKRYQSGQLVCDDTTEFPIPTEPSINNFYQLEYLSLTGYFTELTIWAGIKPLTQLKELHLKSQYLVHPRTMLKLELYLDQLKTWSYTKLAETSNGYREMYKCFRNLPDILGLEKIHVWKFTDDGVKKKVVPCSEFNSLNLRYTGTREQMVPTGFWPEPESESDLDSDSELSISESEHQSNSDQDSEYDQSGNCDEDEELEAEPSN